MKSESVTIQMKATEQFFNVVQLGLRCLPNLNLNLSPLSRVNTQTRRNTKLNAKLDLVTSATKTVLFLLEYHCVCMKRKSH